LYNKDTIVTESLTDADSVECSICWVVFHLQLTMLIYVDRLLSLFWMVC